MDRNLYNTGYNLTLKNAETLFKNSQLIAENKDYGLACSINILSAEEAIKTVYILLKYFDPSSELEDYTKVFKNHTFKHEKIKSMMTIYDIHIRRLKEQFNAFEDLNEFADRIPSEKKQIFENLITVQREVKEYFDDGITIDQLIVWLENANVDKNNGLYVGFYGNKWNTPTDFKKEKFVQEAKFTRKIINMAKQFIYIQEQVKAYINQ